MKQTLIEINDALHEVFPGGETGRKFVHTLGAVLPALLIVPFIEWIHVTLLIVGVTAIVVAIEVLRLRFGVTLFIHDLLLRDYEQNAPAAYMLYMVGMAIVAVLFEPMIAIPAILMLAIADPLAGIFSANELRPIKRPRALAVMFILCAVFALPFAYEQPLAVVLGAAGGMIADGVKPTIREVVVDDDLTVAPMGAAGMWIGWNLDSFSLMVSSVA